MKKVKILTRDPIVAPLAEMHLLIEGIQQMIEWVGTHRPECLPIDIANDNTEPWLDVDWTQLFPHDLKDSLGRHLTSNELLVELAGRKCYDSFGLRAGKKSNAEYIANTQAGEVPHASILYHAKMSFFIAGVSRRVSHELIRNYVGADRDEEGSPSQESTRYTHHYGFYIAHPAIVPAFEPDSQGLIGFEAHQFTEAMQKNYDEYLAYVERGFAAHGGNPKGMERKRIYESASPYLSHACETSFIWTTNPMALAKMFKERDNEGADLEFRRFARVWKKLCVERWPNLFPQPWMRV